MTQSCIFIISDELTVDQLISYSSKCLFIKKKGKKMDGLTGVKHPPFSLSRAIWCPCVVLFREPGPKLLNDTKLQWQPPSSGLIPIFRPEKTGSTIFQLVLLYSSNCRVSSFTSHSPPAQFVTVLVTFSSVTSQ